MEIHRTSGSSSVLLPNHTYAALFNPSQFTSVNNCIPGWLLSLGHSYESSSYIECVIVGKNILGGLPSVKTFLLFHSSHLARHYNGDRILTENIYISDLESCFIHFVLKYQRNVFLLCKICMQWTHSKHALNGLRSVAVSVVPDLSQRSKSVSLIIRCLCHIIAAQFEKGTEKIYSHLSPLDISNWRSCDFKIVPCALCISGIYTSLCFKRTKSVLLYLDMTYSGSTDHGYARLLPPLPQDPNTFWLHE